MSIQVEFSDTEYNFLLRTSILPVNLRQLLIGPERVQNNYRLNFDIEHINEIRKICGNRLERIGTGERYEEVPEHEILESLIDKFFFD